MCYQIFSPEEKHILLNPKYLKLGGGNIFIPIS